MANNNNNKEIYCSFCGKPQDMVLRLIAGNGAYICDRCVNLCMNILDQSGESDFDPSPKGKQPSCVHHCLAGCMQYGSIEDLAKELAEKPNQVLFVPEPYSY